MNIRDLKYLVAVADLKHFGKAAEACFVSQPTLSTQLKKLEDELNVTIFERNNKQVMLSELGKPLIEQARVILREVEELKDLSKLASNPLAGPFKIGLIPTLGPYLLPYIIGPLKKQFPDCDFFLIEEKTQDCLTDLKQGRIDAAILALPIPDQTFTQQPLFNEEFLLTTPIDHALAKKKKVSISDLDDETLLLLQEGHCLRDQALEVCGNTHVNEKTGFQATSLETLRHMVAVGAGVTLLPKLAVLTDTVGNKTLNNIPFSSPAPHREVAMIWRKQSARKTCCIAIAELIQSTIEKIL